MSTALIAILLFTLLILLLGFGMHIGFCLGFLGFLGVVGFFNVGMLYQIADIAASTGTHLFMITLALFLLMAEIVSFSGVGDDLYTAAQDWLSWLPGGLAISSVATCAGFAAISGSSPATAATIGLVAIPEMVKRGYSKRLAVGAIAVGGTLGILIPPSIAMIIYGLITETSIGKLFIAGVIPGIMLSLLLIAAICIAVMIKPSLAPRVEGSSWGSRLSSLRKVWAFVVLAIGVLGAIYTGIATPTESAAIGTTLSMIVALAYGRLSLKSLQGALLRTTSITAMMMFLFIGGNVLAFLLTALTIPQYLAQLILDAEVSRWTVMIMINVLFLIGGCLLDATGIMIILLPILFPIITKLGFDPVWFGIIVTINVEIGMVTPPVGLNLFVLRGCLSRNTGIQMKDIVLGSLPFVLVLLLALTLVLVYPPLATWLPGKMGLN